jgi:hypothetical protein
MQTAPGCVRHVAAAERSGAVAAVLLPVLRREVRRQKRATGASRSGKAAGLDGSGTLTSGAVPYCGRVSIGLGGTVPHHPRRYCFGNPRLSCRGTTMSRWAGLTVVQMLKSTA